MSSGSLRLKREPDYWELRVYAGRDPITLKKRYLSRTFRGGKREAKKALVKLAGEVMHEGPQAEATVSHLVAAHIDHLAARGRQQRTIDGYRSIARRIAADRIGGQLIDKVSVRDFDNFYSRLAGRGLSPATVLRYHTLLGAAFQRGMAWGWVARNTPRLATPPAVHRLPRVIPSPEVVAAVLAEAESSRNPENYVAFRLLALTGARRGEMCGLRWSAVDLEARRITIREAVAKVATGELVHKDPKSHQTRDVSIDARTAEVLRDHRERQRRQAKAIGEPLSGDAFVLADLHQDPTGRTPIQPNRFTQAFRRVADRVEGAEGLRLHDLRHWFASTQLDAGEPLPAVAARIGDNVETLARVYAQRTKRGDEEAA